MGGGEECDVQLHIGYFVGRALKKALGKINGGILEGCCEDDGVERFLI